MIQHHHAQVADHEARTIINIIPDHNDSLKRVGYKSMRGLISMLRRTNKNCKKFGGSVQLIIKLPIK